MTAHYHDARCCAITRAGRRCTGRWASASGCMYAWDPIAGVGIDGPMIVLCHRHRHLVYEERVHFKRARVVHGWLGSANRYGYGLAVFRSARPGDFVPARWWWDRRLPTSSGARSRTDAP